MEKRINRILNLIHKLIISGKTEITVKRKKKSVCNQHYKNGWDNNVLTRTGLSEVSCEYVHKKLFS